VRLGIYPGLDPAAVERDVERFILDSIKSDEWLVAHPPVFNWYGHRNRGYEVSRENPLYDVIGEAHKSVTGEKIGFSAVTACGDMRFWALYTDVPVAQYGGKGYNLHAADEFVNLPSIEQATKVMAFTMLDWCKM
jgi:acetylornithine deacetylase